MATVSSLLCERVTLRVRSVDRLFLHGYLPSLQTPGQLVRFLLDRGYPIPSPALLGHEVRRYANAVERFARAQHVPVVRFARDVVKEDVARPYFAQAERDGRFGVVMVGVAQEKASVWRGWRHGGSDTHPHFESGRQSAHVNYYYFYIRDPQWEPTFVKTVAYAPYGIWRISMGMNGPSARPSKPASGSGRSITASATPTTRRRWRQSAHGSRSPTSKRSWPAGNRCCRPR